MKRNKSKLPLVVAVLIACLAIFMFGLLRKDEAAKVSPLSAEPAPVADTAAPADAASPLTTGPAEDANGAPLSSENKDDLPADLQKALTEPEPPLPEDLQQQLTAPPPPLPDDLKAQLEAPEAPLPPEMQEQLNTPPPPVPEDIERAMQEPPRTVTIEEVNTPLTIDVGNNSGQ